MVFQVKFQENIFFARWIIIINILSVLLSVIVIWIRIRSHLPLRNKFKQYKERSA